MAVRSFDIGWLTTLDVSGGWLFFTSCTLLSACPFPNIRRRDVYRWWEKSLPTIKCN